MLSLSLAHPPMLLKKLENTTGGVIVTCFHVGMPLRVRQVSEHWAIEILRANEEFKV